MNASRTRLALSSALFSAATAGRPPAAALATTLGYASNAKRWRTVRKSWALSSDDFSFLAEKMSFCN